jgi:hypothetical protein
MRSLGKIGFGVGVLCWIGGILLLCYCPVPFIIAAVVFILPAITFRGAWQLLAILLIPVSIFGAIREAQLKQQEHDDAMRKIQLIEERRHVQESNSPNSGNDTHGQNSQD